MIKLLKRFSIILLLLITLIIAFYGTTVFLTWWDGDLEAKYCPPEISDAMDQKIRAAKAFHGPGYVIQSDWDNKVATFERDGQTIDISDMIFGE